MEILLLRTALAPSFVLLASVVARRSGPRMGGLLLGAPTTSGPFLVLMWLHGGSGTAAGAARGNIAAQLVVACFCVAYGRFARVLRPVPTLAAALGCAAAGGVVAAVCRDLWLIAVLELAVVGVGLLTWPAAERAQRRERRARPWELPARMAVSAVTVLVAMAAADSLGSFAGGILSALPVLLAVMALATHRSAGAPGAAAMMRGALTAAPGTLVFLLLVHAVLAAAAAG